MTSPHLVEGPEVKGERSESARTERSEALYRRDEDHTIPIGGGRDLTTRERMLIMEKLLLSPTEAAAHLSIGRSKVYELMRLGHLRSVKIGGSRRIPLAALAEFVNQLDVVR